MAGQSGQQEVARRYATAFFALVQEQSAVDKIADDLESLTKLLALGGDFKAFLNNATLKRADQATALLAVAKEIKLSPLTEKLLGTLAEKRRLPLLGLVVAALQDMIAESRGELTAAVTAAQALDQSQIAAIETNLKKLMGKDVRVHLKVDAEIIGGLVIRVGSRLIDSSVRTKLERMHRTLRNSNSSSDPKKMKEVA